MERKKYLNSSDRVSINPTDPSFSDQPQSDELLKPDPVTVWT